MCTRDATLHSALSPGSHGDFDKLPRLVAVDTAELPGADMEDRVDDEIVAVCQLVGGFVEE
jgi:hypothetical protein